MGGLKQQSWNVLAWIETHQQTYGRSPSYREIADGLSFKSVSTVQHHLQKLEAEQLIVREATKSRTVRSTRSLEPEGIPIQGAIAASGWTEVFADTQDESVLNPLDLLSRCRQRPCFALQVRGESMINAQIRPGDLVVLERPADPQRVSNGTIVAARLEGQTTLKRWFRQGQHVTLVPENPDFQPIPVAASDVEIQGVFVGLVRGF